MNTADDGPSLSKAEQLAQLVRHLRQRTDAAGQTRQVEDAASVASDFLKISEETVFDADIVVARDMLDIAGALTSIAERELVTQVFQKAVQVLTRHPHATVRDRFLSLNNLAAFYDSVGDGTSRDEALSRLLTLATDLTELIDSKTAVAFSTLARLYDRAGNARPSVILYGHLYRYVMSDPNIQTDTRLGVVGRYGTALTNDGQSEEALRMYEQAATAFKKASDFDTSKELALFGLMIRSAQTIGDPERTIFLLERAREFVERTDQKDSVGAFSVYHNLAVLHFQQKNQKKYREAEDLLEHALAILASDGRQATSDYANEVAQLAAIVNANGQPERAEELYREALRIYEGAEGGDASVSSDFLTDVGEFLLRRRRFNEAVAAFKVAQERRGSIADLSVEKRANTFSNLATAYFESGDLPEAIRWYRQAVDTRHQSISQGVKASA